MLRPPHRGTEPGSAAPELGSLLMGWQLGMKSRAGSHPTSGAVEQWKQVFRVVPALPPFFPSVPWQGRLRDGLEATTHMGQKRNPCWVARLLHPRHLLDITSLCRLESTLGRQGKLRDVGEDVQCSVQTKTSCRERAHQDTDTQPLGCIAIRMAWV